MPDPTPPVDKPDPQAEILAQLAAMRQEVARTNATAAQAAQAATAAAQALSAPTKPGMRPVTMNDMEAGRDRVHGELRENPVRLFGETIQIAKAQAKDEIREEFRQELAQRDAIQRGEQFERALFDQNKDVQNRWADVRAAMTWAQQNRPDLTPEQQASLAIETTKARVKQEYDQWETQREEERRQRAFAGSPGSAGAYPPGGPAPPPGYDPNRTYDDLLRERSSVVTDITAAIRSGNRRRASAA